jgi:hypothetical protein
MTATRISKRELFNALGYVPHPGQRLVHRSRAPRRVLACGVRWGKTTAAIMEAIVALLEPRDQAIGWTVAPTFDISRLVFDRVAWHFETYFKSRIVELNSREHKLVVINFAGGKSELHGKTADHATSLLGQGISFAIVDEAARLKPEIWYEYLSQRLLDKRGWALFMSTPCGMSNWYWRLFRRGQNNRDAAFESWSSPSWANPHLDATLIEAERARLPADTFAETFAAEFVGIDPEPCDRCGGPDPKLPGMLLVDGLEDPPTCVDCGGYIDEPTGRTVMARDPDGRARIRVIHLMPRPDGSEALIESCQPPTRTDALVAQTDQSEIVLDA